MKSLSYIPTGKVGTIIKKIGLVDGYADFSVKYLPLGYPFINVVTTSKIKIISSQFKEVFESHSYLCGQLLSSFDMSISKSERILIIQFHPWALNQVFPNGAHCFAHHQLPLADIDPNLANQLEDLVDQGLGSGLLLQKVEAIFSKKLDSQNFDKRVYQAWTKALKSYGEISVKDLTGTINLSERRLQQIFKEHIGLNPKAYTRIIRLQYLIFKTLQNPEETIEIPNAYFDQAHFIHDLKKLTNMPPGAFFDHMRLPLNRMSYLESNLFAQY